MKKMMIIATLLLVMLSSLVLAYTPENYRTIGESNAPVHIEWWGDPECPFTGRFYEQTFPQIMDNYVEKGLVKITYNHFPLSFHEHAFDASLAIECAATHDVIAEYIDDIFNNQDQLDEEHYLLWAQRAGIDQNAFSYCMQRAATEEEVNDAMAQGQQRGVRGTPSFFVNGVKLSGSQPYSAFETAIENALGGGTTDFPVHDTLREGETKTYGSHEVTLIYVSDPIPEETSDDKYEITAAGVAKDADYAPTAKFMVDGQVSQSLYEGDTAEFSNGLYLTAENIIVNNREGIVEFTLDDENVPPPTCTPPADLTDTLREGETKTYMADGIELEATIVFVTDPASGEPKMKMSINGHVTEALGACEKQKLRLDNGVNVVVTPTSILSNSRDGVVTFALLVQKDYNDQLKLFEGETKTITVQGREFEITASGINDDYAKLLVNGQYITVTESSVGEVAGLHFYVDGIGIQDYRSYIVLSKFELTGVPADENEFHVVVGHDAPTSDVVASIDYIRALFGNDPIPVGLALIDTSAYEELTQGELDNMLVTVMAEPYALIMLGDETGQDMHAQAQESKQYFESIGWQSEIISPQRSYLLVENMKGYFVDEVTGEGIEATLNNGECGDYELVDYDLRVCVTSIYRPTIASSCKETNDGRVCTEQMPNWRVSFNVNQKSFSVDEGHSRDFIVDNFQGSVFVKDVTDGNRVHFTLEGGRFVPNSQACQEDLHQCLDGSWVGRTGSNCIFACDEPIDEVVCSADAKVCPDGTSVGRNPYNNCQFYACPSEIEPDEEPNCDNGCILGDRCVPTSTRLANGDSKYCDLYGSFQLQKADGNSCQNDYECLSNSCSKGSCVDFVSDIRESRGLLEKIAGWFNSIFG